MSILTYLQICDYDLKILSVISRFPGSTHDAAIWEVSRDKFFISESWENGDRNSWLLGILNLLWSIIKNGSKT